MNRQMSSVIQHSFIFRDYTKFAITVDNVSKSDTGNRYDIIARNRFGQTTTSTFLDVLCKNRFDWNGRN